MVKGFFYGYDYVVWTAILFQASGGIIVGLSVAYADSILKNFASLLSVLISGVASVYFFDFVLTLPVSSTTNIELTVVSLWIWYGACRHVYIFIIGEALCFGIWLTRGT